MAEPIPSEAAVAALAPTGTLRVAVNMRNFLLVTGTDEAGNPDGVSPDLGRALASSLDVDIELVPFATPDELADAAQLGVWDIGNIGAAPKRAEHIAFTGAYCEIECTYLVPAGAAVVSVDDVDQPGRRIATSARSAYDLWLEANIRHAELVRVAGADASFDVFVEDGLDALAGLRPRLMADVDRLPGARVLEGSFAAVQQAMGTPRDRDPAGCEYLIAFVEHAKTTGLVGALIDKHGVTGRLTVAPLQGR
jgi:polar amino acid transport system substrate-binding protein